MPEPALSPAQLLAQHAEALAELRAILKHQQQVLDALLLLAAQHEDRLATMQRDMTAFQRDVTALTTLHEARGVRTQEVLDALAENQAHVTGILSLLTRVVLGHDGDASSLSNPT
jgi:spore germination protein GerM